MSSMAIPASSGHRLSRWCHLGAVASRRTSTTRLAQSQIVGGAIQTRASRFSAARRRSSRSVWCKAAESEETKKTLSNLDTLLGIEEEAEVPDTPPRREPAAPTPPPTPRPVVVPEVVGEDGKIDFSDKTIASLCYLLPLLDGLKYSKYVLTQAPAVSLLLVPLAPIAQFYYSLGFLQIIFFFALYLGVGQNRALSEFLRFNAMQAIVLDIVLIIPDVFSNLFNGINGPPTGGPLLEAQILFYNSVFFYVYLCSAAGSISSLRGKRIKLPIVGGAAERQTGGGR